MSHYDLETRQAYQNKVEEERLAKVAARNAELETLAGEDAADMTILVAVATKGSGRINEHFGHAKEFQVYELGAGGAKFVGHRRVDLYCQGGFGEDDSLDTTIRAINDCAAVFVAKIGHCPKDQLIAAGIEPVDNTRSNSSNSPRSPTSRTTSISVKRGEITHVVRGDADIRQGAFVSA